MKFGCNGGVQRDETTDVSRESIMMDFLCHVKEFELWQGLDVITSVC